MEKYAYSGRPLLVKNATYDWKAMNSFNFEFFRDLYEDLQSPVLDNEEEGCQFFAWNFKEFKNLQVITKNTKIKKNLTTLKNTLGKSLLELWVTTFLPDLQPPLIFV